MTSRPVENPLLPAAPFAIAKGSSLATLLSSEAVRCLAHNIAVVHRRFDGVAFAKHALRGLSSPGIMQRGEKLAVALRQFLPANYGVAIEILLSSLTPPLERTEGNGLAVFFYLPHTCFVARYGLDPEHNDGHDPFDVSMRAQYELTRRFSAEFSIRPFLIRHQDRTLSRLMAWAHDPDPHVRRLCSEGSRPRLPWGKRIPAFVRDPRPCLPILEALKDDPCLYVRRSVANHLGDIAKDHPDRVFTICRRWLRGSNDDLRWVIRHALRYPARQGNPVALKLRAAAM